MPNTPLRKSVLLISLLAGAALLSACNRNDSDASVGQKVDSAVAGAERRAEQAKADAKETGKEVGQAVDKATDVVASKSRDLAITAAVNARLVGDRELSALGINVDTVDGRVVLRGSAPNTDSRERATTLARGVEGVVDVSNELALKSGG